MSDNQTVNITAGELVSLEKKKLPELQTIAKALGIKRVTGVKKQDLIDQIKEKNVKTPKGVTVKLRPRNKKPTEVTKSQPSLIFKKSEKVDLEEITNVVAKEPEEKPADRSTQKEDELTTYGGQSHIVSYRKKDEETKKPARKKPVHNNNNNRNNNRRTEHDQLPESNAPTLEERITELEPKLGRFCSMKVR